MTTMETHEADDHVLTVSGIDEMCDTELEIIVDGDDNLITFYEEELGFFERLVYGIQYIFGNKAALKKSLRIDSESRNKIIELLQKQNGVGVNVIVRDETVVIYDEQQRYITVKKNKNPEYNSRYPFILDTCVEGSSSKVVDIISGIITVNKKVTGMGPASNHP